MVFIPLFSQKKDKIITENLKKSDFFLQNMNDYKAFEYAHKAYDDASKISNKGYIAESCGFLAASSSNLGLHKKALEYIKTGLKNCSDDDFYLKARFYTFEADVFAQMNMNSEALKSSHKSINILKNEKNEISKNFSIIFNYQRILLIHDGLNNEDSLRHYRNLEKKLLYSLPEDEFYDIYVSYYFTQAKDKIKQKKYEEANNLLSECYKLCNRYNKDMLYICYYGYGNLYNEVNKKKALDYYLKSIAIIEKYKFRTDFLIVYKDLSDLYGALGNKEKKNEYLEKYLKYVENEKEIKQKNVDAVLEIILKNEKSNNIESQKAKIILISLLIVILVFFGIYLLKRQQRSKEEYRKELAESNNLVVDLQHKVNESFSEVVDYAKNNDPLFWARFQELYPHFLNKMLALNPKLKVSELVSCAYIYLGFSNKEIAEYTFKSLRTIENNRYNLRKKLNLSGEEDFAVWIRNYINSM